MGFRSGLSGVVLLTLAGWGFPTEGHAANILEKLFWMNGPNYKAVVPLCDNVMALGKIKHRFSQKEGGFWHSSLTIVDFEEVSETAFMPGPSGAIPRRYCRAAALVSDGVTRPVYYSIAEDTGIIGATWGVEWCVDGLDRNMAYNPRCKMARP
jgi:hypothetical protein